MLHTRFQNEHTGIALFGRVLKPGQSPGKQTVQANYTKKVFYELHVCLPQTEDQHKPYELLEPHLNNQWGS